MKDITDQTLRATGRQVLLRRPEAWDGAAARRLITLSLSRSNARISSKSVRALVACTYRVGVELESAGWLWREVTWPIEQVRLSVLDTLPTAWAEDVRIRLAQNLSAKLCGFEPDRPILMDWVEMVTRAVRQEDAQTPSFELADKLIVGERLRMLYEARIESLVRCAEELLDVELKDICEAMRVTLVLRSIEPGPLLIAKKGARQSDSRLPEDALRSLAELAPQCVRSHFLHWISMLPPIAQVAVNRRVVGLSSGSPLCRMWVKPIVQHSGSGLRELRVIADGVHYRIIFSQEIGVGVRIRAFGFRRDLDELIMSASRS